MTARKCILWLERLGFVLALLLPIFLTHGRALAEIDIGLIATLFVVRCAIWRDWRWLRRGWVCIAGAWWAWLVLCSVRAGLGGTVQAVLILRLLLLVAALEQWLLRDPAHRRWLMWLVRAAAWYLIAQETLQLVAGRNLFGIPRRPSGELTGPYDTARAGPVLSRLLLPAVLPPMARYWANGARFRAAILILGGVFAVVLFGQRMPALLTGLGLLVSALLLPRLRGLVAGGLAAGLLLLAATAVIVPPTFNRMVLRFGDQMRHWPETSYGELSARAVSIAQDSPIFGHGFDAFRTLCERREYWHGWPQILRGDSGFRLVPKPPDTDMGAVWAWYHSYGGAALTCAQHPHSHYLQALVEGGVPGLMLFCGMVLAWLAAIGRGLWRRPDPLRVGLFAAVLIQEWPIASSSDFANMPLGGWFLLLLGLGLAEARWPSAPAMPISAPSSVFRGGVARFAARKTDQTKT